MNHLPHVIYLHGLGSHPASPKATLIADSLRKNGFETSLPSVSLPSLAQLSVDEAIRGVVSHLGKISSVGGVILIGSSFGGFLAAHSLGQIHAEAISRVRALVLLAPALYPWHSTHPIITPQIESEWLKRGVFPVLEGASGVGVPVHYRFIEELKRYDTNSIKLNIPTMIIHGANDSDVHPQQSLDFQLSNPSVVRQLFDDDHQLLADPEKLVFEIVGFIKKHSTAGV